MQRSRLKTIFWLLLAVLTVVCSTSGTLLGQNDWSVGEQTRWLDQTDEVTWPQALLFWNEDQASTQDPEISMELGAWLDDGYMRDRENSNTLTDWDFQSLLLVRPRENEGWLEAEHGEMMRLDRGSSIGNTLAGLKLRPEPVTMAVLMLSNLLTASVRITRKYRPRLR